MSSSRSSGQISFSRKEGETDRWCSICMRRPFSEKRTNEGRQITQGDPRRPWLGETGRPLGSFLPERGERVSLLIKALQISHGSSCLLLRRRKRRQKRRRGMRSRRGRRRRRRRRGESWRDGTGHRVLALHTANVNLIPRIPYGSPRPIKSNSWVITEPGVGLEYHRVCLKIN